MRDRVRPPSRALAALSSTSGSCTPPAGGVPQDYAEAVTWYRKAVDQSDAVTQNNLGIIYGKGQSVPQD
jgi:TPR repeat protein